MLKGAARFLFSSVRVSALILSIQLSGCGRDCQAPYQSGYVFASQSEGVAREGQTAHLNFAFYPEQPYKFKFVASENKPIPGLSITAHGPAETHGRHGYFFLKDKIVPELNSAKWPQISPNRTWYGPKNVLNINVDVTWVQESETQIRVDVGGYGYFHAPRTTKYITLKMSLYPEIYCFGSSDDTAYFSNPVRVDLVR